MGLKLVRVLFGIAGAYDFLIGVAFVFFGPQVFDAVGIPHPDTWAYIHFGSLLLAIFGLMFFAVAYDPHTNRNLIRYGLLLKLSYVGLVLYYWYATNVSVPLVFILFAMIDAVMYALFLMAYLRLPKMSRQPA